MRRRGCRWRRRPVRRGYPRRDRDEHVLGEGHTKLVGDHAAPRTAGRSEAVRGERSFPGGGGAFGGQTALTGWTGAAGHRPRHDHPLPEPQPRHLRPEGGDLGDALMADGERSAERDLSADAAEDRVDQTQRHARLQRTGHGPVDRHGVTIATPGDERPHDRVARIPQCRPVAFMPRQPAASLEPQLAHHHALDSPGPGLAQQPRAMPPRSMTGQGAVPACRATPPGHSRTPPYPGHERPNRG
jgi:hypothetical protein